MFFFSDPRRKARLVLAVIVRRNVRPLNNFQTHRPSFAIISKHVYILFTHWMISFFIARQHTDARY